MRPVHRQAIELAMTFADQAVIAIENVRLFDVVQARTEEQSSVSVRTSFVIVRVVYFPSMFAALRMGDQRAISAFTKLLNFAGVRSPLLGSDPPRSASRVWTPGSSSA